MGTSKTIALASMESMQISLASVREGTAGLNKHRKKLLEKVPNSGDWIKILSGNTTLRDIAFLTAKTGDEFAILTGKKYDILYHGCKNHCVFDDELCDLLIKGQLRIYGHSHPGEWFPMPSHDDRETLRFIGQKRSRLVSAVTGREIEFTDNVFDNLQEGRAKERECIWKC